MFCWCVEVCVVTVFLKMKQIKLQTPKILAIQVVCVCVWVCARNAIKCNLSSAYRSQAMHGGVESEYQQQQQKQRHQSNPFTTIFSRLVQCINPIAYIFHQPHFSQIFPHILPSSISLPFLLHRRPVRKCNRVHQRKRECVCRFLFLLLLSVCCCVAYFGSVIVVAICWCASYHLSLGPRWRWWWLRVAREEAACGCAFCCASFR